MRINKLKYIYITLIIAKILIYVGKLINCIFTNYLKAVSECLFKSQTIVSF